MYVMWLAILNPAFIFKTIISHSWKVQLCELHDLANRMILNREIFRILFLYVSKWIEKFSHLHYSIFNSTISVKICSFEVFNSALLAKFEVQTLVPLFLFHQKFIPHEWTTTKLEWYLCWGVKSILLH